MYTITTGGSSSDSRSRSSHSQGRSYSSTSREGGYSRGGSSSRGGYSSRGPSRGGYSRGGSSSPKPFNAKRSFKKDYIDEKLFILDGTTGQSGIEQAKVFHEAIGISGIVVTKLDGSAGGGIALAVERDLQVPVKLFGFGEGVADNSEFDPDRYLRNLFT